MKRMNFKALFAMLLCFVLCFAICACGDTPPTECTAHVDENKDGKCDVCEAVIEPEGEPEEDVKEITLIESGEAKFQLVVSKNSGGSNVQKAVKGIVTALDDLDVSVNQVTESSSNAKDVEVIIGVPTERGDGYAYDVHQLGPEGYAIKVIGTKILVVGGSDEGLVTAIEVFTEEFLGITKKTKKLDTVVVKATQSTEVPQDDFRITALKLDGTDMKGYTIAADTKNSTAKKVAKYIQDLFYAKAGYWFEIVELDKADKSIVVDIKENTYEGNGYFVKVEDGKLIFETEFPNKFEKLVSDYLTTNVSVQEGEINFKHSTHKYTQNVRDICYTDPEFGAKGNGVADDFFAIKSAHDYANEWGHNIKVSKSSYTFYIKNTINPQDKCETIVVKTSTDWNGSKIIIDDAELSHQGRPRQTPIFTVSPDLVSYDAKDKFAWVTNDNHLTPEITNIGWAPGVEGLLILESDERKLYIRYGSNQDNGQNQQEIIMVDKDGNIFSDTPIMWDYSRITGAKFVPTDERAIKVGNAKIETYTNQGPSVYSYFARNIVIKRSHTTIYGIEHWYSGEGPTGCPYNGINTFEEAAYLTTENCRYEDPPSYVTDEATGGSASMGSYAYTAKKCYNIWWKGVTQSNNHDENGVTISCPLMGTNYCKNLGYDGCDVGSFDAHCGLYNVTIKNTSITTVNLIGDGLAYFENVTFHAGLVSGCITHRDDYGASFKGEIVIKNCIIDAHNKTEVGLINTGNYIYDHNFGYTCYLPKKVTIDGLTMVNGKADVHVFPRLEKYDDRDISVSGANGGAGGINPYIPTEEFYISNADTIKFIFANTPQFKNLKVYMNGAEVTSWKNLYGHK